MKNCREHEGHDMKCCNIQMLNLKKKIKKNRKVSSLMIEILPMATNFYRSERQSSNLLAEIIVYLQDMDYKYKA